MTSKGSARKSKPAVDLNNLQKALDYTFSDINLLKQALTHRSFGKPNNERLEFVGDGILDYVIAFNLFSRYPDCSEGELSKIRASLVNQECLCEIACHIKLGEYLLLGDGEDKSGGRTRPSILADSLEAIFAAISLDADFLTAKTVIESLYQDRLGLVLEVESKDNKSRLQEYVQGLKIAIPKYELIKTTGPEHESVFSVACIIPALDINVNAIGKSKKEASQKAAALALAVIKDGEKNGRSK